MLRLIPAPLHRRLYRLAHHLRARWLRWRGGAVHGASVIGFDGEGRVLLVRHSYGYRRWAFPGGGIARGEDPASAARREFAEELGCELQDLELLGQMEEDYFGAVNHVHVFSGRVAGMPRVDGRELVEARFFSLEHLPSPRSATVTRRLALLRHRNMLNS